MHCNDVAFEIGDYDPLAYAGWSVLFIDTAEAVTEPASRDLLEKLPLQTWALPKATNWVRRRALAVSGRRINRPAMED